MNIINASLNQASYDEMLDLFYDMDPNSLDYDQIFFKICDLLDNKKKQRIID